MTWFVKYMRYHAPGEYEADSLREAISFAMYSIDENTSAPVSILDPHGTVVIGKDELSTIYSEQWGVVPLDEIVAKMVANPPESPTLTPESG